jgi:hypothetical protein
MQCIRKVQPVQFKSGIAVSNQPEQLDILKKKLENTCTVSVYTLNIDLAQAGAGVKALFAGRAECIPGALNRLVVLLLPLVPILVIEWINRLRNLEKKDLTA